MDEKQIRAAAVQAASTFGPGYERSGEFSGDTEGRRRKALLDLADFIADYIRDGSKP